MLQIRLKPKTSTMRFATRFLFFDNLYLKLSKKANRTDLNRKKFFNKFINTTTTIKYYNALPVVIENLYYNKNPYHLIFLVKNIFYQQFKWPGIELLNPGRSCYIYSFKEFQRETPSLLGSCFNLVNLPYNSEICYLQNKTNSKWTFIKSSGTYGVKLKAKKTIKLIAIKLPSQLILFFFKNTMCFLGHNFNFFLNKQVEGKWGFSFNKSKKIVVRGVAKNPVDHPNGGRTKAKQPEKSPWGWIAKHNK